MKPRHVRAREGEIAERVLVSDDYDRIKYLAGMLNDCRLVSSNRGFVVYTGEYENCRISLASHGMGGPSCAILLEEMIMHGAKCIVILGTAGVLIPEINLGEYVIATEARHPAGGLYAGYKAQDDIKTPNRALVRTLMDSFKRRDMVFHTGDVYSNDSYFAEDQDFAERRRAEGSIGVEMECATLFMLGKIRKVSTAAVLIASNTVKDKVYISYDELEERSRAGAEAIFEALKNFEH
jgi:5'-methylthioadenosine phosphorylase